MTAIHDFLGTIYLMWPMTIGIVIVCFFVGLIFAISVGSFLVGFLLTTYYGYIYLKKRGFFEAVLRKTRGAVKVVNDNLHANIRETFLLKGDVSNIPEGPVLYIAHPHGLYSMAPFFHWGAGLTTWPAEKKVHIAIHSIFFKIPIVREIVEAHGAIEANEDEIRTCLEKGESVALLTGGVQEIGETEPGKMKLVLKKRRGFLRIARDLGIPIVPVLSFGENELFPPYKGDWLDRGQTYLKRWFGIAIPMPTFGSVLNWFSLLQGPLEQKVETWVGRPVYGEKRTIESLRKDVFESIHQVYKAGRPSDYPADIEIV